MKRLSLITTAFVASLLFTSCAAKITTSKAIRQLDRIAQSNRQTGKSVVKMEQSTEKIAHATHDAKIVVRTFDDGFTRILQLLRGK